MTDLFPAISLGDALDEEASVIHVYKAESAVTKGQLVIFNTHTAAELPSVSTAGADALNNVGVALQSGSAGQYVRVLVKGIVKVTDSGAGITGGVRIKAGALGTVIAYAEATDTDNMVVGRAVQTLGAGDTGLVNIGAL